MVGDDACLCEDLCGGVELDYEAQSPPERAFHYDVQTFSFRGIHSLIG